MFKYRKSIYALLAAFAFYLLFGYLIPEIVGVPRAVQSISATIETMVVIITAVLIVQSLVYFLTARKD